MPAFGDELARVDYALWLALGAYRARNGTLYGGEMPFTCPCIEPLQP